MRLPGFNTSVPKAMAKPVVPQPKFGNDHKMFDPREDMRSLFDWVRGQPYQSSLMTPEQIAEVARATMPKPPEREGEQLAFDFSGGRDGRSV